MARALALPTNRPVAGVGTLSCPVIVSSAVEAATRRFVFFGPGKLDYESLVTHLGAVQLSQSILCIRLVLEFNERVFLKKIDVIQITKLPEFFFHIWFPELRYFDVQTSGRWNVARHLK